MPIVETILTTIFCNKVVDQKDDNCLNLDLIDFRKKRHETLPQLNKNDEHLFYTTWNYKTLHNNERLFIPNFFKKRALKSF